MPFAISFAVYAIIRTEPVSRLRANRREARFVTDAKKKPVSGTLVLHLMILVPLVFIIIFNYAPMAGIVIAFKNYKPGLGILGSPWVGLQNFQRMFLTHDMSRAFRNTLAIALMKIVANLAVPILFALLLNEVTNRKYKRAVQTITYLPYFLSWVVLGGIFIDLLSPTDGYVNRLIQSMGFEPLYFLGDKQLFRQTIVLTDVWKNFGYNTIVYLAALTNIDPALYEVAAVDGAGHWKRTLHITLPGILNFVVLMTILSVGQILNAGFDQVFNLYNVSVYETGDILDTMVYRTGILQQQYSFSTAVGLFRSAIGLILIASCNKLARVYAGYRVF
jgi:putative aldouronate transport system permease protein